MDSGFFHAQKTPFTPLFTPVGIFYPIFGGTNPGSGVYFFYEFFHPGGTVLLHLVRHVPIYIQRERCCGVAQILLYRLHAVPFLQGRYGECMSHIVEPGIRAADPGTDCLEPLQCGLRDDVFPDGVGEDKVPFVLPEQSGGQSGFSLGGVFFPEQIHNKRGGGDRSRFFVFGGGYVKAAAFFLFLLQLLPDGDGAGCKVHCIPRQAADFPLSHPREQSHTEQAGQRFPALVQLCEECGNFRFRKRGDFSLGQAGRVAGIGGVVPDVPKLDRLCQGFVEDPVDAVHRFRGKAFVSGQVVIEGLYVGGGQVGELYFPQSRADVGFDPALVGGEGQGFAGVGGVFVQPGIQPCGNGDPGGFQIIPVVCGFLGGTHGLEGIGLPVGIEGAAFPGNGGTGFPPAVGTLSYGTVILGVYLFGHWWSPLTPIFISFISFRNIIITHSTCIYHLDITHFIIIWKVIIDIDW